MDFQTYLTEGHWKTTLNKLGISYSTDVLKNEEWKKEFTKILKSNKAGKLLGIFFDSDKYIHIVGETGIVAVDAEVKDDKIHFLPMSVKVFHRVKGE